MNTVLREKAVENRYSKKIEFGILIHIYIAVVIVTVYRIVEN